MPVGTVLLAYICLSAISSVTFRPGSIDYSCRGLQGMGISGSQSWVHKLPVWILIDWEGAAKYE